MSVTREMTYKEKVIHEFKLVARMNEAFFNKGGIALSDSNNFIGYEESKQKLSKQIINVLDELRETSQAIVAYKSFDTLSVQSGSISERADELKEKALKDFRDGLCDVKVFALGALHFVIDPEFEKYQESRFINWEEIDDKKFQLDNDVKIFTNLFKISYLVGRLVENLTVNTNENYSLYHIVADCVQKIYNLVTEIQISCGINYISDMNAVIEGVMSRFCANREIMQQTIDFWAEKGVTDIYIEGEFPNKVIKSAVDQPDAPKGKFLKSVTTKQPVFKSMPFVSIGEL